GREAERDALREALGLPARDLGGLLVAEGLHLGERRRGGGRGPWGYADGPAEDGVGLLLGDGGTARRGRAGGPARAIDGHPCEEVDALQLGEQVLERGGVRRSVHPGLRAARDLVVLRLRGGSRIGRDELEERLRHGAWSGGRRRVRAVAHGLGL